MPVKDILIRSGNMANSATLLAAISEYRTARLKLLESLGCHRSNRDPLAEFSERLVAALIDGHLAESRVQRDFDVIGKDGEKVQVKYLANPSGPWVNGHQVKFTGQMDRWAVVFFENLEPRAVIIFSKAGLLGLNARLQKRYAHQDTELQITHQNYKDIVADPLGFEQYGVAVCALSAEQVSIES